MRATLLPKVIIRTKAHRSAVSMMARRCIVASVLPLRYFLFLLTNYINICAILMQYFSYTEGSIATGILPTPNTSLSSLPMGSKVFYFRVGHKGSIFPTFLFCNESHIALGNCFRIQGYQQKNTHLKM